MSKQKRSSSAESVWRKTMFSLHCDICSQPVLDKSVRSLFNTIFKMNNVHWPCPSAHFSALQGSNHIGLSFLLSGGGFLSVCLDCTQSSLNPAGPSAWIQTHGSQRRDDFLPEWHSQILDWPRPASHSRGQPLKLTGLPSTSLSRQKETPLLSSRIKPSFPAQILIC